jgi:hypothetical protein
MLKLNINYKLMNRLILIFNVNSAIIPKVMINTDKTTVTTLHELVMIYEQRELWDYLDYNSH